jgi:transglutaminase-like putative cysteine protease
VCIAQSVPKYVSVNKAPAWVEVQSFSFEEFADANTDNKIYRLVDRQQRIEKKTKIFYSRLATTLLSADAVENNSSIEITFDPEYQTVVVHRVNLIRDGKIIDKLDLKSFNLFRAETDTDKLIYNGTMNASYIVPGVRVGDTLDYAYSVKGRNPALGTHYVTHPQLRYGVPIQKLFRHIQIENSIPQYTRSYVTPIPPKITEFDGFTHYEWSFENLVKKDVDDDRPTWHFSHPAYGISSYASWAEVGEYFAKYYEPSTKIPAELEALTDTIKSEHVDKKKQIRAVLDLVQREVRYLGIELGSGGYIPRDPELVWQRRFGDCKDMTLLLLTLLKELDVEAVPILVNLDEKGGVDKTIQSHGQFDHVLVQVNFDGTLYYLDATRGEQLGDLDHMAQGWYGKGVIVSHDSPGLVDIDVEGKTWWREFYDHFDLVSDLETVSLKSVGIYHGAKADSMRSWYKREGHEAAEKAFLEYYQANHTTIKQVKPLVVETFPDMSKITFTGYYEIPDAWIDDAENSIKTFSAYPSELTSEFPKFTGGERKSPFAFAHPIRTKHIISFTVNDTWAFDDEEFERDNEAFKFAKTSTFKDNKYTQEYSFVTKMDHIKAAKFSRTMSDVEISRDEQGVEMQYGTGETSQISEKQYGAMYMIWVYVAALISLIVLVIRKRPIPDYWKELKFYPVNPWKFLIMSCVSVGMYQVYWTFKNWQWLTTAKDETPSPAVMAFFSGFTNFLLFSKMSDDEYEGYRWFSFFAVPLALLYLGLRVLGRIAAKIDGSPTWLALLPFLSFLVLFPVVLHINKMNEGQSDLIKENSKNSWLTYSFIAMFTPAFIVVVLGAFVILVG